jgi:hypothetical protein
MDKTAIARKVATAVETTIQFVEEGQEPSAALAKAAKEHSLLPEYVKLAAYAYNTGAQQAQRQESDGILDKVADFAIADADKAIETIWGPKEVEKVSSDYSSAPLWAERNYRQQDLSRIRSLQSPTLEKSAEHLTSVKERETGDPKIAMAHAYNRSLTEKRSAEEARYQASAANNRMLVAVSQLGDYFKLAEMDRLPLRDVEWHANVKYGEKVTPLFSYVRGRNRMKDAAVDMEKDAAQVRSMRVDPSQAPWSLIENCIKTAEEYLGLEEASKAKAADCETKVASLLDPYGGPPGKKSQPPVEKGATGFLGGLMAGSLVGNPAAATAGLRRAGTGLSGAQDALKRQTSEAVESQLMALEDPAHEEELKKIRAEAMLQDFLANDEIIGGHEPENVLQHYNELAQLMPEASGQPAVMRSALRERLTTQPATFDAAQLADIEKSLQEARRGRVQSQPTELSTGLPGA